jgi:hypothetical protein
MTIARRLLKTAELYETDLEEATTRAGSIPRRSLLGQVHTNRLRSL